MASFHVRLEGDVARMAAKVAKRNSRSIPKEVNHVLREHYTTPLHRIVGIGSNGENSENATYSTVLDPTPRHYEACAAPSKKTLRRRHAKNMMNARG